MHDAIYSYKVSLLHSKPYKTLKTGIGFIILDLSLKNFKETAYHCVKVKVLGLQLLRATVNLDFTISQTLLVKTGNSKNESLPLLENQHSVALLSLAYIS